ncbi:MAG: hypothetical protein DVB25_04015 [Verrucomicrobia bacterium]|nr:MAG: hypothetical protein DVB25_04015 [Verrucomicrobiota bacterium]
MLRFSPVIGDASVAGEAVVEDEQALAHLGQAVLGSWVVLVAEHQVQDVGGGSGGGERRARVLVLSEAVLNGVFSQFCCGGGEFRAGTNGRLGEEEMQRVVVAVMGRIELIGEAQFVLGLAPKIAFEAFAGSLGIGACFGGLAQGNEQSSQPDTQGGWRVCRRGLRLDLSLDLGRAQAFPLGG